MKYLYIDESYDEKVFVVGGIIANSDATVSKTYNKFKKQLRNYPLLESKKRLISTEFKSVVLDKSFPKIKNMLLTYINKYNINIVYSYKRITGKLKQNKKEEIYIKLLKEIINKIDDEIILITFDTFNNTHLNNKIIKELKQLSKIKDVFCLNSFESKGLKFADNVVGTVRRHLSGIDINNDFDIISSKVI